MKEVQFKSGEKRMVTDRTAMLYAKKGMLKKEEKNILETKEEKHKPATKKK